MLNFNKTILSLLVIILFICCSKDEGTNNSINNTSIERFSPWSPVFENQTSNFVQTRTGTKGTIEERTIIITSESTNTSTSEEEINKDVNLDGDFLDSINLNVIQYTTSENLGSFQIETFSIIDDISSDIVSIPFVSKSERYSPINETTGYFQNQNNFLRYLTNSEMMKLMIIENNCTEYWTGSQDWVSSDFNNDGFLDLFLFMYQFDKEFKGCEPRKNFGTGLKPADILIIDNYFNGGTTTYRYDTSYFWAAGGTFLSDIDNDGTNEVVMFNNNRHEYHIDNSIPLKGILVVDINSDFSIEQTELSYTPFDLHYGTTGDVDNDGDIDLIKIKIMLGGQNNNQNFPKTMLNNGDGTFNEINLLKNQTELENQFNGGWSSTVYSLFDLNNDNYLDLIAGLDMNYQLLPDYDELKTPTNIQEFFGEVVILWGDSSGQFSTDNYTLLKDSNYLNSIQISLGLSFSDFDGDGDVDVIVTSTPKYNGYIINLFRNDGDKKFTDVTTEVFDESNDYWTYFGNFYGLYSIDKDDDGDYDLVPSNSNWWNHSKPTTNNLYWENIGGRYSIRKLN